jgi:cytidine deaminase
MINKTELIKEAFEARKNSYSPYSGYRVGAALLFADGTTVSGCNVENASYGLCNCAERTAVFKAVSEGFKDPVAIAIAGGTEEGYTTSDYAYPCGACRQVLREFADPGTFTVIVAKSIDDYREHTLEELLPLSFGPDNLG